MKKFIAFVAIIATITALLAMPVSAAKIFYHDFENPPASGNLRDVGDGVTWKPYNDSMAGVVTFEDGAVKIDYASEGRPFWNVHYNVPGQDHVLMFDLKSEISNPNLSFQYFMGGTRVINKQLYINGAKADTWYTYMIVTTNGATKARVFYRERDAVDAAWAEWDVYNSTNNTDGTRDAHTKTDFKMGFDSASNATKTEAIWYDNYTVYDETWFDNMDINLDGAPVEEIADVVCGGTISVNFDVYDSDIQFDDNMEFAELHSAKAIMVALDKNMKMVACNTVNIPMKSHRNSISVDLELSDDATDPNYYGNLADGGQINFYMWENMQPIFDPIVID